MSKEFNYQEKVLLTALEITKKGKRGYEFHVNGESLFLTPWFDVEDKRLYAQTMRITGDKIFCRDKGISCELERKITELELNNFFK